MSPYVFGLLALAIVGPASVVAFARDPRTAITALVVVLVAAAGLYAALGAPVASAAQAIFYAGGAAAFVLVVRGVDVGEVLPRTGGIRPVRAAAASVLVMAALAKAQLGTGAVTLPATLPPTIVAPPSGSVPLAAYLAPAGLALLVLVTAVIAAPPLPRRPRRTAEARE